jgi:hypothetical protein
VIVWLAWAFAIIGFQSLVAARLDLARPDYSMDWTAKETTRTAQDDKPYLVEPFMNNQVAWDSEFYLSVAVTGYDDPLVRSAEDPSGRTWTLSYAFMPLYPLATRVLSWPLGLLGLNSIATAALAAVIVSLLGTLAGMLALWDMAREQLGDDAGIRAAFYLVAFPAGFFLAQVYTEGLFVGLAFGCLAMIRRKQMIPAAILAVLATWTRAAGVALAIPMLLPWLMGGDWLELDREWKQWFFQGVPWKAVGLAAVALAPMFAFGLWKLSPLGSGFGFIEDRFFGRGLLSLGSSFFTWSQAFSSLFGSNPQRAAYYVVEFLAIAMGFIGCARMLRRYPDVTLFSLTVIILSLTSGPAQGMHRYVLGAPALFLFLGDAGRHPAFDRAWTIVSILLMGMLATLYTFNMWVG